jgi:predicted transcriptional regulator with HTH domain
MELTEDETTELYLWSLVGKGLVEAEERDGETIFRITDLGKRVLGEAK